MTISIAMATYNGERFIREQLDSLAAQTRLPDELVITDDGSTDRTLEIIGDFARDAPFPVRVYRNDRNLGYTRNFFRAAGLCTGQWIAYCDQDDVWLPGKLETVERNMEGQAVMLIVHSAEIVDKSLASTGVRYPNFRRRRIRESHELPTWWIVEGFVMTFRSELISCLSGPDGESVDRQRPVPRGHDAAICRIARVLGDVVILPDRLVLHRWHAASITSGFLPEEAQGIRRSRKLISRVRRVIERHGGDTYMQQSREARIQAMECHLLGQRPEYGQWHQKLLRAEGEFLAFAEWMAERGLLYRQARLWLRIGQLCRLVDGGGYLRFSGRSLIGAREFAKNLVLDAIVAIVGAGAPSRAQTDEAPGVHRNHDNQP